jgi:hypothetical protein
MLSEETLNRNSRPLNEVVRMWPTPRASDATHGGPNQRDSNGYPALPSAVRMWPTPTVGAGLCGGTGNFQQLQKLKEDGVISEEERRNMSQGNGGQLNPTWVSVMMGYPPDWTEVD